MLRGFVICALQLGFGSGGSLLGVWSRVLTSVPMMLT